MVVPRLSSSLCPVLTSPAWVLFHLVYFSLPVLCFCVFYQVIKRVLRRFGTAEPEKKQVFKSVSISTNYTCV